MKSGTLLGLWAYCHYFQLDRLSSPKRCQDENDENGESGDENDERRWER